MKTVIKLLAATLTATLGAFLLVPAGSVSAHNGTLTPDKVCVDGQYVITYQGKTNNVPQGVTANISLRTADTQPSGSTFQGLPITGLGANAPFSFKQTVPGTTTYAQAAVDITWSNGVKDDPIGKINLKGDCKPPPTKVPLPVPEFHEGDCDNDPSWTVPPSTDQYTVTTTGTPGFGNTVTVDFAPKGNVELVGQTHYEHTFQAKPADEVCNPPTEVTPPAPTPVDKCGTVDDGVIIPPASEAYSYHKLVDGFDGGLLNPGFNAWTGKIIVTPNQGFIFPGGTQTVWEFEFSDEPCKPTEWPAPTQEVICGAEDVIHVPDDTEDVTFVGKGGPGHTIVHAKWKFDGSILQTWEFTDDGEECPEPELSIKALTPVCVADAPFIDVTLLGDGVLNGQTATITFVDVNGISVATHQVVFDSGSTYRFIYPGASVDANGNPTDWPGWRFELSTGLWVPDGSDAHLREGLTVTVEVNPTATGEVEYPAATETCANPPANPVVTPANVTFANPTCVTGGSYTIPATAGVVYKQNGVVRATGTYPASGTVVITAEATTGYVLDKAHSWTHTFSAPPSTESCSKNPLPATGMNAEHKAAAMGIGALLILAGIPLILVTRRRPTSLN